MPQPLSRIIPAGAPYEIRFSAEALSTQPGLSALIAEIFARWSALDHGLNLVVIHTLHAAPESALAMFSEVMDTSVKRNMIRVAAKTGLREDDFEALEAVLMLARQRADFRNKLAHWLWGKTPQVPDALLLIDPRKMMSFNRTSQQFSLEDSATRFARMQTGQLDFPKFDFDEIFVYKQQDSDSEIAIQKEFELIINDFLLSIDQSLFELGRQISQSFGEPGKHDLVGEARLRLSNRPQFAEALSRLRKGRKKTPEVQP